jgi:hypothetical protein
MRNTLLYSAQVWMFSHYLGLSAWALAFLGLRNAPPGARRFAIGSIALGLGFAWGIRNEDLQALIGHIPLVSGLRFPTKHLAGMSLGLSVLAAGGVKGSASWTSSERRRVLAGLFIAIAACALLFYRATDERAPFDVTALIGPSLAIAALLGILRLRGAASTAWILPGLVALDLLGSNRAVNPTTPSSFFKDRPPLSAVIPPGSRLYTSDYSIQLQDPPTRLPEGAPYALARAPLGFSRDETLALAATWYLNPPSASRFGYYGSFDLDVLDFYRAPLKAAIRTFVTSRDPGFIIDRLRRGSVDFVVTMDPEALWSSLPLVTQEQNFFATPVRVYRVTDRWPRVRLEAEDGSLLPPSPQVVEYVDGRVRAEVDVPEASRLVVAAAYDPGWRATVDGVPAPVRENEMAFLSIPLKVGHHRVDFSYRPPLLLEGAFLSVLSALAMLGLAARKDAPDASRSGGGFGGAPVQQEGEEQEQRGQHGETHADHREGG